MKIPPRPWLCPSVLVATILGLVTARGADLGAVPTANDGRALNLGFEDGTLRDWKVEGNAFAAAVVEGDAVHARRGDMRSNHQGRFWVGSYERGGDEAKGTLTSAPFRLTKPYLSFLIGAGSFTTTRAEVVRGDTGAVIARASGDDVEDMRRVSFDLTPHVGKDVFIRLVDDDSRGWGHVNFDDVRLHDSVVFGTQKPNADAFLHAGLTPEDAARAMTVPDGFRVTLFAGEPDVHQPIGFTIDDRGRLWVAEAYSYPVRVPEDQARDQILIFEDKDGDGHFDSRKVFADKLNLVSGIELGYRRRLRRRGPAAPLHPRPRWRRPSRRPGRGPPRRLGVSGHARDPELVHLGPRRLALRLPRRVHPLEGRQAGDARRRPRPDQRRDLALPPDPPDQFEVFAHGTSNPWGLAWDAHGQAFETACVIPHLFQMIPGGRYERQAGAHFNPYTYDDIKTIADHRHFVGANPQWAANGKSGDVGGGHAHCGALIYQGGAWPEEYAGSIFMNNIHGARLNRDLLAPRGSGFVGKPRAGLPLQPTTRGRRSSASRPAPTARSTSSTGTTASSATTSGPTSTTGPTAGSSSSATARPSR